MNIQQYLNLTIHHNAYTFTYFLDIIPRDIYSRSSYEKAPWVILMQPFRLACGAFSPLFPMRW